jgi:hypothetical protein
MYALRKISWNEDEMLANLKDAILHSELKYTCRDFYGLGVDSLNEVEAAIQYSIQILLRADVSPQQHFRYVFLTDIESGKVFHNWEMSNLGFLLTLLNIQNKNPQFDRLKIEILNQFLQS